MSPLAAIPFARAEQDPAGRCLRDDGRTFDNAGFAADVRRLAQRLGRLGIAPGDTVAVMLPNCAEIVTTMFAAWYRGSALTPVNAALTDDEARYQLQDSAAAVLVGDERARELAASVGIAWLDAASIHADTRPPEPDAGPVAAADDFALIIYTSGTTGRPKGVLLDHANLDAMSGSLVEHFALTAADTSLLVLPLFHANGLIAGTLAPLRAGGDVVVAPRFSPDTLWDLVETQRPTYFSAVPTIYAVLDARTAREVDTSSLRFLVCGAAPMPAELIVRFEQRFGVPVVEGYGLSEGSVASTINPLDGPRRPGTVGVALPGQEVAVVSPSGERLPPGSRGEVVIRGANVMRGYLGRPEETATVIRDGWLHTGDVGILDEDGYLRIVDRIKDLIIRGGENIYPKEIEECLYAHPAVLEAAVVGRPHPVLGEVPVAYVAPRPGHVVTPEQLHAHCAAGLARYKVPDAFEVRTELPKNSVGKLVKGLLREPSTV
ncbi:class I adenylate-forming enzyme family protein [Nocardioides nitrophenolicus]|uniref:class I adenylate-forming enzyme family protein n=1 Tax=Nocardioides nitrophenolicus TaxID=60489 RepID=UPI0027DB5AF2|nr:AMP-binding protein [Nocardioides nitrophenolicus]MBM7515588.1 acyl-CoA synthetase (AMP-forming)/AMP-acid ligase II [Nocardioides nitrophenolicus]